MIVVFLIGAEGAVRSGCAKSRILSADPSDVRSAFTPIDLTQRQVINKFILSLYRFQLYLRLLIQLHHMMIGLKIWLKRIDGVSSIEFAIVSPVILLLLFGIICFGSIENTYIDVQQLTAEAARASVAGLTDADRSQIVQSFVTNNIGSYAFLDPTKITVTSATISSNPSTYQVNITYDMSGSFIYQLDNLIPLPSPTVQRSAVVLNGGS
jgi:Flp pilus assembly protein TadG